jgi:hypothetical protein
VALGWKLSGQPGYAMCPSKVIRCHKAMALENKLITVHLLAIKTQIKGMYNGYILAMPRMIINDVLER